MNLYSLQLLLLKTGYEVAKLFAFVATNSVFPVSHSPMFIEKKKNITATDLYYASLILYFVLSMCLSTKLCGPDTNFYFQLLHKASFYALTCFVYLL